MTTQFSTAVRNAMAEAAETAIGTAPTLRIRTGAMPANAAAARQGTILAQVALATDWLGNAANGVKNAAAIPEFAATASGTAGHYEIMQGSVCHWQGTVTETGEGGSMQLASTDLVANQLVRINSLSLTVGGA